MSAILYAGFGPDPRPGNRRAIRERRIHWGFVDDPLERARQLLSYYDDELRRLLPRDVEIFDAHVHLGHDIDGFSGQYEELERIMATYDVSGAFMFCMDEPDREPAFRAPNDRTLAFAERSEGRLIPFVRLDMKESPIEEAVRCLDLGARGIKLHPRAQRFQLNDKRLAPVFELAAERRVPILIHGGRGLPPIADHLSRLVDQYPDAQLIIAHAGIADLAALAGQFAGRRGVFFDTSVWSPVDLLDFFHQVPPEQVLYATDYPYGRQPQSLLNALRTAITAGLDERQLRDMLAGNAKRIAAGEEPLEPSTPSGTDVFSQSMALARIHQYLSMATPLLWTRQQDTIGVIGLALNACYERDGYPEELERIKELLTTAQVLWRAVPEIEEEGERLATSRATFALIHLADIISVTPGA
jgi:predicted TIM-barrel fold metal-dependent hydrolase